MSEHIFLTYACDDGDRIATQLYDHLVEYAFKVSKHVLDAPWTTAIEERFASVQVVLIVLTHTAITSPRLPVIQDQSRKYHHRMIIVVGDDCEVPCSLKEFHIISFQKRFTRAFNRLLRILNIALSNQSLRVPNPVLQPPDEIRVVIVDDFPVIREGLSTILGDHDGIKLVGEADSGMKGVYVVEKERPHVVLMDVEMPGMNGIAATRIIRRRFPEVQVVILTAYGDHEKIAAALEAGAINFLFKEVTGDELIAILRDAVAGQAVFSPAFTDALIESVINPPPPDFNLTPRELDVLTLIARGLTNADIASELNVSVASIKAYVSKIMEKMEVNKRSGAAALAIQQGLIQTS
jgi:two-component system, NarL family, response regulator LiaR